MLTMHNYAGHARRYHPVAGVLVTLCLVCTVLLISDDTSQPIVREEAPKGSTSAQAWLHRVSKVSHLSRHIKRAKAVKAKAVRLSAKAAIKAQKLAMVKQHEANQLARKQMRRAATKSAKSMMGKALAEMSTKLHHLATHAAKKAAKAIVPKKSGSPRVAAAGHRRTKAETKLKMLEKDVVLLEAAQKKAVQELKTVQVKFRLKSAKYKALINTKVMKVKHDFEHMKEKLASYKGTKHKQRKVAHHLRVTAQLVVHMSRRLNRMQRHIKHVKHHGAKVLARWRKKVNRKKTSLARLKTHYKRSVQQLEATLKTIRAKKDINTLMASRISAEQGVVTQQQQKLAQADATIARLHQKIKQRKLWWKKHQKQAKKRKEVLGIAHMAYTKLERTVASLKHMAAITGHTTVVSAPKMSAERNVKRMQKRMVKTVRELVKKRAPQMAKSVARAAAVAAAKAANDATDKHVRIHLRGLTKAMAKAQASIAAINHTPKAPHPKHKKHSGLHPLKSVKKLVKKTRKAGLSSNIKRAEVRAVHKSHGH